MAIAVSHTGEMHGCTRIVPSFVFDFVALEEFDLALHQRIVRFARFGEQRKNRIHHRGINRSQAFAALEPFEHPLPRALERKFSKRLPRQAFVELQAAFERQKHIAPGDDAAYPTRKRAASGPAL